jgi:DNA-binding PadR family transcriptional regulator
MKRAGWVKTEWRTTENNRRARYYLLTPVGRKQLGVEAANWGKASEAVNAFLRTSSLEGNA